jgi:TDG/mug DNA glycosylase family protein
LAIGLTSQRLRPDEFRLLPEFGIGLTGNATAMSGSDDQISVCAHNRDGFIVRIPAKQPKHLALDSKKAVSHLLHWPAWQSAHAPAATFADFPPITMSR